MSILCFSDILVKVGLDPKRVKLLRHSMRDKGFRACSEAGMIYEYTCHQSRDFSKNYDYWVVFVSDKSTMAKLYACYKVGEWIPDTPDKVADGFPEIEAQTFQGNAACYDLQYVDLLAEYENRLIIDWGKAAISWHQKGTTEKPIISIQADAKRVFSGFEDLILTYDDLKDIIDNPSIYEAWHTALASVYAVYLIVDRESGRQYVGSAYGKDGLLGRWSCYVASQHGHNKQMKELVCQYPERYHAFQFSILQILPKTITEDEVIQLEKRYKQKLLSVQFGMNDN